MWVGLVGGAGGSFFPGFCGLSVVRSLGVFCGAFCLVVSAFWGGFLFGGLRGASCLVVYSLMEWAFVSGFAWCELSLLTRVLLHPD